MNTNNLKIYMRVDAKGNVIPGSAVRRKKKPRIGKWVEVSNSNICCSEV